MEATGNPWENVTTEQSLSQTNLDMEPKAETSNEEDVPEEEISSKIVRYLVNFWHFFDFLIGSNLMAYGVFLWVEARLPKAFLGSLIALGFSLTLRACVGTYSLYKEFFNRFGMVSSAYQSLAMSFLLLIAGIISLFERHKISPYLSRHTQDMHLPDFFVHFVDKHIYFVCILFLILCGIEAIRWTALLNYREYLLEDDELSVQLSLQATSRNRKPWWWKPHHTSNNQTGELREPLLEPNWTVSNNHSYQMDEGLDHGNNSSTIWSSIFGRRGRNNRNPRDDGSVDFASVQEEWASRSEQDPLWWSREEGKADGV
mmetsp:Transcript_31929/g.47126  ORF Transcript_31929/g.47126 Transcript_31929/m.47126 type:complete len:315 (+) Transcript_31929:68-1012(+)